MSKFDETAVVQPDKASVQNPKVVAIRKAFAEVMRAISKNDLDLADANLEVLVTLTGRHFDDPEVLFLRTTIAIQRGRSRDALNMLNGLGEDVCPELRAMCLYSIQDPSWEGLAESLRNSPKPHVAKAMGKMLDRYRAVMRANSAPTRALA